MPTSKRTDKLGVLHVTGLTEGEARQLVSRLRYMKASGIVSRKVGYHGHGTTVVSAEDGLRRKTYGGL
jgi:hypothetical protein